MRVVTPQHSDVLGLVGVILGPSILAQAMPGSIIEDAGLFRPLNAAGNTSFVLKGDGLQKAGMFRRGVELMEEHWESMALSSLEPGSRLSSDLSKQDEESSAAGN